MAYRVTLKPSGHAYECEDGKNVLQAGLEAGHMMPYSCRAGPMQPHVRASRTFPKAEGRSPSSLSGTTSASAPTRGVEA